MSQRKKTDILKVSIGAALAAASVILVWFFTQPRFQNIATALIFAAVAAFSAETLLLTVLRGKNILKRTIKILLLFAINIAVFTCAVIYSFAPAVILQPHSDDVSHKALKNVPFAEEMSFEGTNGLINGWFYKAAGDDAPTVLYFYGNYETAATRLLSLSKNYESSAFVGCNFAIFDYPAYGKSEGNCTDRSILQFALDVFDELSRNTNDIIVLGYSVGTGPACYLASKREVRALILYAPYADGADLYNNVIDIFHGPLEKLVSFDVSSIEYVKNIAETTLILASEKDELIPLASSMRLSERFNGNCVFIKTSEISHNQFLANSFVRDATKNFINEVTAE